MMESMKQIVFIAIFDQLRQLSLHEFFQIFPFIEKMILGGWTYIFWTPIFRTSTGNSFLFSILAFQILHTV